MSRELDRRLDELSNYARHLMGVEEGMANSPERASMTRSLVHRWIVGELEWAKSEALRIIEAREHGSEERSKG